MTPEEAVRGYLTFVTRSAPQADEATVEAARQRLADAPDEIARAQAQAELEALTRPNEEYLRQSFIRYARAWTQLHGLSADAFRSMGVPENVLIEARLVEAELRPRRDDAPRPRRLQPASQKAITAWVLGRRTSFTTKDVELRVGGSPATIKRAIDTLVKEGKLQNVGPDPKHTGRGRAPTRYQVVQRVPAKEEHPPRERRRHPAPALEEPKKPRKKPGAVRERR